MTRVGDFSLVQSVEQHQFRLGAHADTDYAARRRSLFVIAVNCGQAGGTCFCVSMRTGPAASRPLDAITRRIHSWLALIEVLIAVLTFLVPLALGIYFPYRFWNGRYRVRAFAGICPRCGRQLQLAPRTRIALPQAVTCFACHFEPLLEVQEAAAAPIPEPLRHVRADCTGVWAEEWMWDERFMACDACGARRPATPQTRRLAFAENERGALLRQLTEEGRYLS